MSQISRRRVLTVAAGGMAGLAVASAATATAGESVPAPQQASDAADDLGPFDEVYKRRRIQGVPTSDGHGGHHNGHDVGYRVFIDGRELHVMRNADGTWISIVTHYEVHRTPLAIARAAVDYLKGAQLAPLDLG